MSAPKKRKQNAASGDADSSSVVIAFKGFNSKWQCRGYQYSIGGTAVHNGKVVQCTKSGFHACENPLDVFTYYPPCGDGGALNRFALVELSGEIARSEEDSKIAAGRLNVKAELQIHALVDYAVRWILDHITDTKSEANTGYCSAATNTGYGSAATNTGDKSAATNTGYGSAATNTGDSSAATNTGRRSAATNTGDRSAATNTGDRSAATNTGYRSAASVEGKNSVAIAIGAEGRAKACVGSAIVLCFCDDDGTLLHIRAGIAGRDGIKSDTWYSLNEYGEFVECDA